MELQSHFLSQAVCLYMFAVCAAIVVLLVVCAYAGVVKERCK